MEMLFTQYLRPNGRKHLVSTDCPRGYEKIYDAATRDGVYFDIEVLSSGHVSMTAEKLDEEGEPNVLSIQLCKNRQ